MSNILDRIDSAIDERHVGSTHDPWKCWICRFTRMAFYLAIGLLLLVLIVKHCEL
jgi:hypothetical protein